MAEAIREAYEDIFTINETPGDKDRGAIKGRFKSTHNVSDSLAECMTKTFYAFLKLADLEAVKRPHRDKKTEKTPEAESGKMKTTTPAVAIAGLNYNIQIHLPATKDIEVFNAIFKSLKEHLLE